jgi:aminopeptidase YwaD
MRIWCLAALLIGCSSPAPLGPTDQKKLAQTLVDLAAMGPKHAGTDGTAQAARYLVARMKALGLGQVHTESFRFPRWDLDSSSLAVSIDGAEMAPGFDVFEASGSGHADAPLVWAATAHDSDLAGLDLAGKIALVARDPGFHRAAQLRNVAAHGAAAMIMLSIAPANLRQVGSVRFTFESADAIPALTVGADDGKMLQDALTANRSVRGVVDVAARSTPADGQNVVARLDGERPEQIVIGAHYDTWFAGATDNGSGVAELLALAERRRHKPRARYTLVFVAYDGEEVALYGGYDYLRKHKIVAADPILAVLNLETPSAKDATLLGLGRSNQPVLDDALLGAGLNFLYNLYAGLEVVAELLGGILPTDIQGAYRSGVPTVSTAVTGPYYHTVEDTPDKVDLQLLADSTDGFDAALDALMSAEPSAFAAVDDRLWTAAVTLGAGDPLTVEATVADGDGALQAGVPAHAALLYDDFFVAAEADALTDGGGRAQFQFPAAVAQMGSGNRFVHVTAGPRYPMVEKILALP